LWVLAAALLALTGCATVYEVLEYQRCGCDGWYLSEIARRPTPPLNFRELFWESVDLDGFNTVHQFTFIEWENHAAHYVTDWEYAFILFPDQNLRDFSLHHLGLNGGGDEMAFYTKEILLTIPEFAAGDALALNLHLSHYLIPRAGFTFVDESGQMHRMLVQDGTPRGGCGPHFGISHHDPQWGFGWAD